MKILFLSLMMTFFYGSTALGQERGEGSDWIFMDLGGVILNTDDWKNVHYYPDIHSHTHELKKLGIKIGLIVNIPESFGLTCLDKFTQLQSFVADVLKDTQPFDWTFYDRIVLPPNDELRKPHPYTFLVAAREACPARFAYEGEDKEEIKTAHGLGIATYTVGASAERILNPNSFSRLLESNFQLIHPSNCDYKSYLDDAAPRLSELACVINPKESL